MNLKVSLACFKKQDLGLYRLAMEKLDGLEMHYAHFCDNPGCVHSTTEPGSRARTGGRDVCRWCDADALAVTEGSIEGRKRLNQALKIGRAHV